MMRLTFYFLLLALIILPMSEAAQTFAADPHVHDMHHEHHGMRMDMEGTVMNENLDQLPRDCTKISGEREITVHAGRKYAQQFNGMMFTYDEREWNVEPCSKVTVTLINEDQVRHQWMIHDLPRYLYPEGMFHIEVNGHGKETGTFIVPSAKKTYLVHCDIAQHTEKGMKAQLKVSGGNGDLPSILGITGARQPDVYPGQWNSWALGVMLVAGLAGALMVGRLLIAPS